MWLLSLHLQICLFWKKRHLRVCLPPPGEPVTGGRRQGLHSKSQDQESHRASSTGCEAFPRKEAVQLQVVPLCTELACPQRAVLHQAADWHVKGRKPLLLTENFSGPQIAAQHSAKSRIICSSPCCPFKLLLTLGLVTHFCSYLRMSTWLDPGINTSGRD